MQQVLASEESRSIYSWVVRGHWNRGATCRAEGEKHAVEKIETLPYRKRQETEKEERQSIQDIIDSKECRRITCRFICMSSSMQEFCQIPFNPAFWSFRRLYFLFFLFQSVESLNFPHRALAV